LIKNLQGGFSIFGSGASTIALERWLRYWNNGCHNFQLILILAGSCTAEVPGISAAGATAIARRYTAIADAELLLNGPSTLMDSPLPPLDNGVSPALLSHVAARLLGVSPIVIAVGLAKWPLFPHIRLEKTSYGPAACLSTGNAMEMLRVEKLWRKGVSMGRKLQRPLVLAECVPGGTSTAQAVLAGLGLSIGHLISSSEKNPPINLKQQLVSKGLVRSSFGDDPSPFEVIASLGDPFQPVAAGLLIGAREVGQPVLLGGGSQMLAVLALAMSSLKPELRERFIDGISLATTAWLVEETSPSLAGESALEELLNIVGMHFGVRLFGIASGLRFHKSKYQPLRDYELGFVKEGVGAGALILLAQIKEISVQELASYCEKAMGELEKTLNPVVDQ